jgi:hypothetical protein
MHKHTAQPPTCSAAVVIADGAGLLITARRPADLRGGWRQAVRRAVDAEQDDLCAGPIPGYNHGFPPHGTRRHRPALTVRFKCIRSAGRQGIDNG